MARTKRAATEVVDEEQVKREVGKCAFTFLMVNMSSETRLGNIDIEYTSQNIQVIISAWEYVTPNDIAILLAAIFASHLKSEKNELVSAFCNMKDIKNILRDNFSADEIFQSITKLQSMIFSLNTARSHITSRILYIVEWDQKTNEVLIILDRDFHNVCKNEMHSICRGGEING